MNSPCAVASISPIDNTVITVHVSVRVVAESIADFLQNLTVLSVFNLISLQSFVECLVYKRSKGAQI